METRLFYLFQYLVLNMIYKLTNRDSGVGLWAKLITYTVFIPIVARCAIVEFSDHDMS